MADPKQHGFDTLALHAGQHPDPVFGARAEHRIGMLPRMERQRVEAMLFRVGHRLLLVAAAGRYCAVQAPSTGSAAPRIWSAAAEQR